MFYLVNASKPFFTSSLATVQGCPYKFYALRFIKETRVLRYPYLLLPQAPASHPPTPRASQTSCYKL